MEKSKQLDWISTLRGLAILLVFFSHLESEGGATIKFILGRIGVVVFFLLSGYLAVEARKKRSSRQYIFNRLIRMYPVYWVILFLTFLSRNILHTGSAITVGTLLGNMTLFHQFIGIKEILGASWMMPIQVCFFLGIGFFEITAFTEKNKNQNEYADMKTVLLFIVMLLSVVTSFVRYIVGVPFPTAFFLLIAVALLGLYFPINIRGGILQRSIIIRAFLFEVGLLISTKLSYSESFIAYIVAYNVGILLFVAAFYIKPNVSCFNKLSKLGFAFFLGAKFPIGIVKLYIDFSQSVLMQIAGWFIEFILVVLFSWVITRYIENPLFAWGKAIEMKLGKL